MLRKTLLGDTGLAISRIGLGTVKFGRNTQVKYPERFDLPNDQSILNLLSVAQDLGVNLLDTAPAYGSSEERLGSLLKKDRHHWVLSTKFGEDYQKGQSHFDFSKPAAKKSIERSLKLLNTDYLDIVLVHSDGQDKKIIEEHEVFDTLAELKKSGIIRAFGMSTKTIEGGLLAVQHSDIVMVTYNPNKTADRAVIQHAALHNKGIFIKKGLASGHIQTFQADHPVQNAIEFIFKEPGVSSVILGTLNPLHLKEVVEAAAACGRVD